MKDIYPHGLRVFLKTQMQDGSLHSLDLPLGRACLQLDRDDLFFTIHDADDNYLASIAIDSVAMILPLQIVGPSDANNQA